MKLKVVAADRDDIYKDIIRIPEPFRKDNRERTIPEGKLCKVRVMNKSVAAILRGYKNSTEAIIALDEIQRNRLGISVDEDVEIDINVIGIIGEFQWAYRASEPAYRIAGKMGLLSLTLGILGLLLSLFSMCNH
jgi:hypothetical protein